MIATEVRAKKSPSRLPITYNMGFMKGSGIGEVGHTIELWSQYLCVCLFFRISQLGNDAISNTNDDTNIFKTANLCSRKLVNCGICAKFTPIKITDATEIHN